MERGGKVNGLKPRGDRTGGIDGRRGRAALSRKRDTLSSEMRRVEPTEAMRDARR